LLLVCHVRPASDGEQAITRVGRQQALREASAAACNDCRAKVEVYATVGKHAATRRYKPLLREGPGRLVELKLSVPDLPHGVGVYTSPNPLPSRGLCYFSSTRFFLSNQVKSTDVIRPIPVATFF